MTLPILFFSALTALGQLPPVLPAPAHVQTYHAVQFISNSAFSDARYFTQTNGRTWTWKNPNTGTGIDCLVYSGRVQGNLDFAHPVNIGTNLQWPLPKPPVVFTFGYGGQSFLCCTGAPLYAQQFFRATASTNLAGLVASVVPIEASPDMLTWTTYDALVVTGAEFSVTQSK